MKAHLDGKTSLLLSILAVVVLFPVSRSIASQLPEPAGLTLSDPIRIRGQVFSSADPLVIEGLKVENSDGAGIVIEECGNVVIRNNRISQCQGSGILVKNSDGVIVQENTLESNRSGGVVFEGVTDSSISNNRFMVSGNSHGIGAYGVKNVDILDNEFSASDGVESTRSSHELNYAIWIEDYRSTESNRLVGSEEILISGNRIDDPSLSGISVISSKHVEIRDNLLQQNSRHGIRMRDVEETTVHHNEVYDASKYGLYLEFNVSDSKIYENTISGGSLAGIMIRDSCDNSVYRNQISERSGNAIILRFSLEQGDESAPQTAGNAIFENNLSVQRGVEAILVEDGCSGNQISNNEVSEI